MSQTPKPSSPAQSPDPFKPPDDFYRLLTDQAGYAMIAADMHGRITAWNNAASRLFGAHPADMLGINWITLIPAAERTSAAQIMTAALEEGLSGEFEFSMRGLHGEQRRLAAFITPVSTASELRIGGLACVRDITNRVILQTQLSQQSKMASLGEMAGALSHHFNNILGGVVTSVDFALASGDPNIQTRVMQKTAKALSRATDLVDSLLAFAEGDFRDATLGEIGEVVIEVVAEIDKQLVDAKVKCNIKLAPIPVVEVPRAAFRTILMNLIRNAIEAMPGGGTLTVATECDEKSVSVVVADTGCGLDEDSVFRVFEPFYSTKQQSADDGLGRGLGLAVAHGIIKVLNGTVHVSSTVGEGTRFEVRLPIPKST